MFAAGVFDFITGLKLTMKRGELMGAADGGAMAAIIGMEETAVRGTLQKCGLNEIDIANINSPNQIVISGSKQDITYAQAYFADAGALKYVVLNVSGAFHSRYMADAKAEFEKCIRIFQFHQPEIPIISNVSARPYPKEQSAIKDILAQQMVSSVKWVETICYLMEKGETEFEQIGPGNVINGLVKNIKRMANNLAA